MVVPPHLPERYCPVLHLTFVQVVQLPFFVVDEPARYWLPVLHEGWLAHWVSAVPAQLLVLYLPAAQPEQALHLKPLVVPEQAPLRYWPPGQVALEQVLHLKPSVVPEHEPLRYWPPGQVVLLQALHLKPLVVPEQAPLRYWPPGQLALLQVLHR